MIRDGRISDSNAPAAASNPWSFSITSNNPPSPLNFDAGSAFCHWNRNRTKLAWDTGSISRRSRPMVDRWILARMRRSQYSWSVASGRKLPRSTNPSISNWVSTVMTSDTGRRKTWENSVAVNGPEHSTHPRTNDNLASSRDVSVAETGDTRGTGSTRASG